MCKSEHSQAGIATISIYSKKTLYELPVPYYKLLPLSITTSYLLSVPLYVLFILFYTLSVPLTYSPFPLLHNACPLSYILSVPPYYILSVPTLLSVRLPLLHTGQPYFTYCRTYPYILRYCPDLGGGQTKENRHMIIAQI